MNNSQHKKAVTNFFSTLLIIALSTLSWYLLNSVVIPENKLSSDVVLIIQGAIIISFLLAIVMGYSYFKGPATAKKNEQKLEQIIEQASIDPTQTRSAIIRLHQILDPEHMKTAISLATLLEQLLVTIESTGKEQKMQHQENVSLSRTATDLKEKHEQLIKAPRLRSEFLSRMGDEITSPMNSLGTMIKLLNEMEFEPEARDLLVIASHSAHSLIENLTNILEFSQLDVQRLKLQKKHFNVAKTISSVLETQESIALSKTLLLESQIKPDVPDVIFGDQKSIMKVLNNILSNAIRFTSEGNINLVVDNLTNESQNLLRFTVIDTGIGIPESALKNLFDSLDKDTDLVNSSFAGRLRLIVSKQLCELMGGEIGVRSKQGVGSQFWFTIDISNNT